MNMADHTDPLQIVPDPATLHAFHRQQLSAMLDGELSPDEARFMLRRLEHDVELARCWERWQVCGEVLRGRAEGLLPGDFAARVAVAVQARSPRPDTSANFRQRPRLLWGGMGIAASLALAAVLLVRLPADETVPVEEIAADIPVPARLPGIEVELAETVPVSSVSDIPRVRMPGVVGPAAVATLAANPSERAARELLAPAEVPVPVLPRPWPRAGAGGSAFSVGYGPASMDPFQPRWTPPPSAFWPETQMQQVPVHGDAGRNASRQD